MIVTNSPYLRFAAERRSVEYVMAALNCRRSRAQEGLASAREELQERQANCLEAVAVLEQSGAVKIPSVLRSRWQEVALEGDPNVQEFVRAFRRHSRTARPAARAQRMDA